MKPMAATGNMKPIISTASGGLHNITPPRLSDMSFVRRVRDDSDSDSSSDSSSDDEVCVWNKDRDIADMCHCWAKDMLFNEKGDKKGRTHAYSSCCEKIVNKAKSKNCVDYKKHLIYNNKNCTSECEEWKECAQGGAKKYEHGNYHSTCYAVDNPAAEWPGSDENKATPPGGNPLGCIQTVIFVYLVMYVIIGLLLQ
ncbi:uncharacterized protein LOC142358014 [Convolutriloba macropyga]|uniref:uncharacterized protein LOC142358014 n=1 Tax=Convolutriloba macropyga TaxID=536237 RepID=UPI003F5246FF